MHFIHVLEATWEVNLASELSHGCDKVNRFIQIAFVTQEKKDTRSCWIPHCKEAGRRRTLLLALALYIKQMWTFVWFEPPGNNFKVLSHLFQHRFGPW